MSPVAGGAPWSEPRTRCDPHARANRDKHHEVLPARPVAALPAACGAPSPLQVGHHVAEATHSERCLQGLHYSKSSHRVSAAGRAHQSC